MLLSYPELSITGWVLSIFDLLQLAISMSRFSSKLTYSDVHIDLPKIVALAAKKWHNTHIRTADIHHTQLFMHELYRYISSHSVVCFFLSEEEETNIRKTSTHWDDKSKWNENIKWPTTFDRTGLFCIFIIYFIFMVKSLGVHFSCVCMCDSINSTLVLKPNRYPKNYIAK